MFRLMPLNAIESANLGATQLNPDRSVGVAATFDAQYPRDTMLDSNQRKRAKCTNASFLRLTFTIATISDIVIFNTNATTIDVQVTGSTTYTVVGYNTLKTQPAQANSAQNNYVQNEHVFQIGTTITSATVTIDLFHPSDFIEIGYITAGIPYQIGRAVIGSNEAVKDFSKEAVSQDGGLQVEIGSIRRDVEYLIFARNEHAHHLRDIVEAYRGQRVCVFTTDSSDEKFNYCRLGYLKISNQSQDNIGITYNLLLKEG